VPEIEMNTLERIRVLLLKVSRYSKHVAELIEMYRNEDFKDEVREEYKKRAKSTLDEVKSTVDELKSLVGKIL